jgi:peptide/nickel transport system substrate-binding protein/oligopeptide transport system substrate-binding protein
LLGQAQSNCKGDSTTDPDYCPYISTKSAPGGQLQPIVIATNSSNATRVEIVKAAADAWNSVLGLNVQEQTVTFHDILKIYTDTPSANPFQGWSVGWLADYPDPQDWLTLQFNSAAISPTGYNAAALSDPNLDALFAKADVEQDPTKRMQLYNQAEQMVVNDVGWLPYMQEKAKWRMRPWVRGFGLNPQASIPDISWPNVYITAH